MKRLVSIFVLMVLLTGCGSAKQGLDGALTFRKQLLAAENCQFDAVVTADYSDRVYTFGLTCQTDADGKVTFTVTSPETIQGITGYLDGNGGALTFDDQILAFPKMADGQITPVSAPWILMKTLRGGFLSACEDIKDGYRLTINDSYEENAMQLIIETNRDYYPTGAEVYWKGQRILTVQVSNFTMQ